MRLFIALFFFIFLPISYGLNIHTVHVSVGGSCCAQFLISTKVGHFKHGKCKLEQETPPQPISICDVHPPGEFHLNGARLKELIGGGWTCGATHVQTQIGGEEGFDHFRLFSVNSDYIATEPSVGHIVIHLCPSK